MNDTEDDELLRAKLNLETARIAWKELQRHFASGNVLAVSAGSDLVDIAVGMARDDRDQVEAWLGDGTLAPVSDAQALAWYEEDAELWAVVVRPFVVVQDGR